MPTLTPKAIKIIKTCNLYLLFLAEGMGIAVPGPTLLDLQNLVSTDLRTIAYVYTARSTGAAIGSFGGGIIFDLIKRKQYVLTFFNLFSSITLLAIPWSRSIETLTTWMVINGFCLGVLDTGANVCCLNLWGKDSGPFFQALHFTFGVGGLIAPLIAAPFVGKDLPDTTIFLNATSHDLGIGNITAAATPGLPSVTYVYSIIGIYQLVVTLLFLTVALISPLDALGQQDESTQGLNRSLSVILVIVFLNFVLLFVETGTEIGFAQMLATYAVKSKLQLSPSLGSFMTSAFWAAFTVTRFLSVFLAMKFNGLTLIVSDIVITSIGAVVLMFLAATNEWALWLATILLGIGIASFYPAAVSWVSQYITVTNKIAASFTIGACFGEMVIPYTVSHFIEEVPEVLSYVVAASCVLCAIITFILYLIYNALKEKPSKLEGVVNIALEVDCVQEEGAC